MGLAEAAGLKVDDGVVVDEHLQASAPGVFAAGDVASAWHPHYRRRLRVEHWANASTRASRPARTPSAGPRPTPGCRTSSPTSTTSAWSTSATGSPDDAVVVRGDRDARELIAFWQRDGVVTAAMNVNVWDVVEDLKAIVAEPLRRCRAPGRPGRRPGRPGAPMTGHGTGR